MLLDVHALGQQFWASKQVRVVEQLELVITNYPIIKQAIQEEKVSFTTSTGTIKKKGKENADNSQTELFPNSVILRRKLVGHGISTIVDLVQQ